MGKFALKALLGILILATTFATATTITLTPVADGMGTVGDESQFAVQGGSITIDSSGMANITLQFNYPAADLNTSFTDFGIVLKPTDLLFQVGTDLYGIPIVTHSLAPDNASGTYPTVIAGDLYQTTAFQTSQTVLDDPSGVIYRNNDPVWLGGTPTLLSGPLTETISSKGTTSPEFTVTLSGDLSGAFLSDVDAQGVTAYFGSATCDNGFLSGSASAVPEPQSLFLMGGTLLGLSTLLRRKLLVK
jgi:hypothetical protein